MIQVLFDRCSELITFWPSVALFVVLGIACLKYGADGLVNGAANLGFRLGMSTMLIGLTIVAFGTSAPELVVSLMASAQDKTHLTLGNIIGSNIANTTLILGASALMAPLLIQKDTIKFDGPISTAAAVLIWLLAVVDGEIGIMDGMILVAGFVYWTIWMLRKNQRRKSVDAAVLQAEFDEEVVFHKRSIAVDVVLILVGFAVLVFGADILVIGAVETARALKVTEVVVGLTVVAIGTSLPELAVALVAAQKEHADIAVGNVLGSNIFNTLLILGLAVIIAPMSFQISQFSLTGDAGTLFIDIPFSIVTCLVVLAMMKRDRRLARGEGVILVGLYVFYLVTLVLRQL